MTVTEFAPAKRGGAPRLPWAIEIPVSQATSIEPARVFVSYDSRPTSPIVPPRVGASSENSPREKVVERLAALMRDSAGESFEDGTESNLARQLQRLLTAFGEELILSFPMAFGSARTTPAAISEALTNLGAFRDGATEESRLQLLLSYVGHADSLVRYGAACGLWELGDKRAAPALLQRARSEPNELVRSVLLGAGNDLA